MKELNLKKQNELKTASKFNSQKFDNDKIISLTECKRYFRNTSDEKINHLRNNLIGVINTVMNTYFEEFR